MSSQSSRPGTNYMCMLNNYLQTRQQIQSLSWVEMPSPQGPRGAGWVVHCKVAGEIRGSGEGAQKAVAREVAARQAYESLHDTPE